MHAALLLLAFALPDSWRPAWTPYTLTTDQGEQRQLLKAVIHFPTPTPPNTRITLHDPAGAQLDDALVPTGTKGDWPHGFWLPPNTRAIELRTGSESRTLTLPAPPAAALPLRLDRLNRGLLKHLIAREAAAAPPPTAALPDYLAQHDIVYHHPSPTWVDGLPLGNGDVGALVSGTEHREQVIHLDKTDIWLADPNGQGLGRSYAGTLRIRYRSAPNAPFTQRLSLARAEVETRDGDLKTTARVHANANILEVEGDAPNGVEVDIERTPVTLWVNQRSGYKNAEMLYGSWSKGVTPEQMAAMRAEAAKAPHTKVEWGREGDTRWFLNTAPNMRYAVAVRVTTARKAFRLRAAIVTSRESDNPVAAARALLNQPNARAQHIDWWQAFWNRSWIDLPDKLEENLWYIGLYQQAACSRSDQAVSFFGLWHPLEHRTWYDAYVADAQVPMIWWQTFASNHLELLYPSHRTFARILPEFVRRTPGPGLVVPHFFLPEWAGGNDFFIGRNPHKGSGPWYALNFWWDYLYSGDRDFLRDVTYPLLRMGADWLIADLVKEADGRYHCLNSGSPEQDDTTRDNIYDWAMIRSFLTACVRASETLAVDEPLRAQWRDRLDHLFPAPTSDGTLAEALNNPHPYRCHPVVFFGLFPTNAIDYNSPLIEAARRAMPIITTPLGFRYEDRHTAIPNYLGGVEPNGFSSGILTTTAARLGDRALYERFLYGLIVRFHLKQNGLRALIDTRQSDDISRSSLVEAANAHTTAISESLVQSWDDHVRLFPAIPAKGRVRFHGLRAAGGFVISAEAIDGRLRGARIQCLRDATLNLAISDSERLSVTCRAGETRNIGAPPDLTLTPAQPRTAPRTINLSQVEDGSLLQYPEDLPFGQIVKDSRLYLGIPAAYGPPSPLPVIAVLKQDSTRSDWRTRQTAARLLARLPATPESLELLDRLCADPMHLVAHTAAVTLVHLGTPESLAMAQKHATLGRVPGLRREVEKANKRLHR